MGTYDNIHSSSTATGPIRTASSRERIIIDIRHYYIRHWVPTCYNYEFLEDLQTHRV